MTVPAGKKNRKIVIQKKAGARDAANQPVDTWVFFRDRWANFSGDNGRSAIRNSQEGIALATNRVSFRINHDRARLFTTDMRIVMDGLIYDIRAVRHDEARRQYTDLIAEEGGNNG